MDELNIERRKIEDEMKEQAHQALNQLSLKEQEMALPIALCLFDKTWHQGVIGILAGRLKERYHRPVIAFALSNEGELKGSARSIPQLNIRDILAAIDKDNPGLIIKFGGHAMAAGLSLNKDNFSLFQKTFVMEVSKHIDASITEGILLSDGALSGEEFNLELATLLQMAGPWGQQFPEPVFDNVFEVIEQRIVGKNHLKLTLVPKGGSECIDAIAFNVDLTLWPNHRARFVHAAYKLDINEYQGRKRLQLMILSLESAAD